MGKINLRPYQQECIAAVVYDVKNGYLKIIIALPTGAGKTIVFAHFARALGLLNKRILVLAHRQELLEQAAEKISWCEPGLSIGIEQADKHAGNSQVVVASVQTLQNERLLTLNPEEFGLVIIDEAHHAVAPTYQKIIEHFKCGEKNAPVLIGCTATPQRGDNIALETVFDKISYSLGIYTLIEQGYLCSIKGRRIKTDTDISNVKIQRGDFKTKELSYTVNTKERNELVIKCYKDIEKAAKRRLKTVAFCVDVDHALTLAEMMRGYGISSQAIHGNCNATDRKQILKDFHDGKIDVLTNCMVLTEGFDEPSVECLLMTRPTRSSLLYVQMVGRGLRLAERKKFCYVVDFVDVTDKHSIFSLATLTGLPPKISKKLTTNEKEKKEDKKDFNPYEIAKTLEEFSNEFPWVDINKIEDLEQIQYAAYDIDFFSNAVPNEISQWTNNQYISMIDGSYRLQTPENEIIMIRPTHVGYQVTGSEIDLEASKNRRNKVRKIIYQDNFKTLRQAVIASDLLINKWKPEATKLFDTRAYWREQSVTDKQAQLLVKFGFKNPSLLNKGQASFIISSIFSNKNSNAKAAYRKF